jgi:hypothetical protein
MPELEHLSRKLPRQGIVNAAGELTISIGPGGNQIWEITQVTLEMPTAPAGAIAELRVMGSLIAPAYSARRASASGDPPIVLHGSETMTVEWTGCTPGDVGRILVIYRQGKY